MTDEQKAHCSAIAKSFEIRMSTKYKKGQEEHGGNLWDMTKEQLLDNAIDEAIDQVVYLLTLQNYPEYER